MRKKIFTKILKCVGVPIFLIGWIFKTICTLTYSSVGLLYKKDVISNKKGGKVAYFLVSLIYLGIIVLLFTHLNNWKPLDAIAVIFYKTSYLYGII